ncbi:4Fe-4S binding protein [Bacteroidales bacterium]
MYKWLKRGRVIVSLTITVFITLAFLFISNRDNFFFSSLLKYQFVPALLGVFTGSAIILVSLVLLSLLFGRLYCSTICPLGTLQDSVWRISSLFRSKKKRRFSFSRANNILRYSFLSVAAIPLLFGSSFVISLLDPYSNYGKISSEIISRSEQFIHNMLSSVFPDTIFFRAYSQFIAISFFFALLFLLIVVIMSAFRGRLYCNSICPVGTTLGFISKFSAFKPVINIDNCNKCKLCVSNCKSECIDIENGNIDISRCVTCFNCMTVCKRKAVTYKLVWGKKTDNEKRVITGRREALLTMGLLGSFVAARAIGRKSSSLPRETENGIAPPGAVSVKNLKSNCTACQACVSACPNGIIKPATGEYGLSGLLMPVLSFEKHFCGYDCNVCAQVCPNGALIPQSLEEKKLTQIGQVRFYKERCIVVTDNTACGACDEHCPTKAITMVAYNNEGLTIPVVDRGICIGCGGCEYVCPAAEKAMIVEPRAVHKLADKPKEEKQEKVVVDEFGF